MAKLERRPAEHAAVAGIFVQLLAGVLGLVFTGVSGSLCVRVLSWQALIGVLPWVISLIRIRQSRLADEEAAEWGRFQAEREAGGGRGTLFEEGELQAFVARNRLRILETYVCPIFSVIVMLLMGLVVALEIWGCVGAETLESSIVVERALVSVAFLSGLTFVLFMVAMYALGMSRQAEWRALRAGGSYMMLTTLFGAASVVSLALAQFDVLKPDFYVAWVMLGIMGLVTVEILLNFVLDFYRPRVIGVEARPAYDSRFLGIVAEPTGILRTVAATLDYQFGFKVSQTWFYLFVEKAIAPLILIMLLTLYALSCFVIVGPSEQAIVERWGVFQRVEGPGLFVKWPWPVDRTYRYQTKGTRTLSLGHAGKEIAGLDEFVWTRTHYKEEFETMVATKETEMTSKKEGEVPVNLVVAAMTVRYRVPDVEKWHYNTSDPEKLLEGLCNREMMKYLAGVDLLEFMGRGREEAAEKLREMMQMTADAIPGRKDVGDGLGVTILDVGLEEIHPPVQEGLPEAFHKVVSAEQNRETEKFKGEVKAIKTRIDAVAKAETRILKAMGEYAEKVYEAEGKAKLFVVQSKLYRDPDIKTVFKHMVYFDALIESLGDVRMLILGVDGLTTEHLRLNLEDAYRSGLADIKPFESDQTKELENQKENR